MMSARFVHAHGQQGRLTAFVNRGFEFVRRGYARLLDGALEMRWPIVVAALLDHGVGVAAVFVLAARARAGRGSESHQPVLRGVARLRRSTAVDRSSQEVVHARSARSRKRSSSLVADRVVGRLRRHGREALARARRAPPRRCTAICTRRCRRCRACACSRASIRRCRRRDNTTSSSCCRATSRRSTCCEAADAVLGGRLAERQVPLRRHRPEDRSAAGARRARSRADRRPRARPRGRGAGARHAARRQLRQPVQLLRPQLQGDSADRRRRPRLGRRRCSI